MSRPPRLRTTRTARRLACGCHVAAGTTVASKRGKAWVCAVHQPWIRRTVADILNEAAKGQ